MRGGWVYMMSDGTLYTGVTSDLEGRVHEHRALLIRGFTRRYGLTRLVWYEHYPDIYWAIQREHNIKHWPRAWKVRLIHEHNRDWEDLYPSLAL